MNRHQRRTAASISGASGSAWVGCSRDHLARAALVMDQAQQPGLAELLREMMAGSLGVVHVTERDGVVDMAVLARADRPTVLVVGDDDYKSSGPSGWRCAATITTWADCAVVHAAGATAATYREAIRAAYVTGRCALIETDVAHAPAWVQIFTGKRTLLVLPREGVHPIPPAKRDVQ